MSKPRDDIQSSATVDIEKIGKSLRAGDVLLVDGTSRISSAIKYLTQSTWSHAALCAGAALEPKGTEPGERLLLEADINEGVRSVSLSRYGNFHTRICRPIGLSESDVEAVVNYMCQRLGHQYDLKNIFDLARYLIQTPPVPARYRRRLVALGSGDPTRAICSSLIAQAFQSIHYPILPYVQAQDSEVAKYPRELLELRHHSLFVPRDFDISPYFQIIKPTIEHNFDFRALSWQTEDERS